MNTDLIRSILNIVFLALAVGAMATYFTCDFKVFLYVCSAAIFVKLMEFFLRFMC